MFLFAGVVVGSFWVYWTLANRPFVNLHAAILRQFPDAVPQVIGGREKYSDTTEPQTLRIVLRVDEFDPNADPERAEDTADRLEVLAWTNLVKDDYGRLEVVLFRKYRESRSAYWTRVRDVSTGKLVEPGSSDRVPRTPRPASASPKSATPAASARI